MGINKSFAKPNQRPLKCGQSITQCRLSPCMSTAHCHENDGTTGQPAIKHMGVCQGCPFSPPLFGIFFHGLHDHLQAAVAAAGLQLRSGRLVSALVYADDVALLSWTDHGLHQLIDGMQDFRQHVNLTISPTKTEVVVFNRASSGVSYTWQVGSILLYWLASLMYLGLIFHECSSMTPALKMLLQIDNGAR